MKRLIAFVAALYPRSWRAEFGDEFDGLLDDVKPRWRVFANVLGGAIRMQITEGGNWLKLVAATAVLGAIVAWGMSFRVAPNYVSSAVISVTPQSDPVRATSPQVIRQRAAARVKEMESQILSRSYLSRIIQLPPFDLYREERERLPLEDVIELMRHNIRIQARSALDEGPDDGLAPIVFSISFSYPDQVKAHAVAQELAREFTETNLDINKEDADAYRGFWQDMSAHGYTKLAPPPPAGEIVGVLNPASAPTESAPNRIVFLAWGLGAGLLLGLLVALALRWPRGVLRLGGFALAGCVLAGSASFLLPNRYISTATMEIWSAAITEDPLAATPPAPPAAEFLRQMEPEIFSVQRLSQIIQNPRLNLYPMERAKLPMDEVVRNMLARDLRIAPLNPASGAKGTVSAFIISFSYYDRYKAQQTVQSVMNAIDEVNQEQQRARAIASHDEMRIKITQRKAGEWVGVLDVPSLPGSPVWPNRLVIAALGFFGGLVIGAITLWLRRPRMPVLQPA